jgi:glycosyltransferase involved in cell wall biosynthesis
MEIPTAPGRDEPPRPGADGPRAPLPLISVVTPCFNARNTVLAAVESVVGQAYPRVEHIVVDGGSSDGTREVLARCDRLRVLSEPDRGMYDALNKAVSLVQGRIVTWLNADDAFAEGALLAFGRAFVEDPSAEMICGRCEVVEIESGVVAVVHENQFTHPADFRRGHITHGGAMLNACAFTADLLRRVGSFDTSYRISGDRDMLLRLALAAPEVRRIERVTYRYRRHAGSMTMSRRGVDRIRLQQARERLRLYPSYLRRRDLPRPLRAYCLGRYRDEAADLLRYYLGASDHASALAVLKDAVGLDPLFPFWAARKTASVARDLLTGKSP